jgi:hypothetical protein
VNGFFLQLGYLLDGPEEKRKETDKMNRKEYVETRK